MASDGGRAPVSNTQLAAHADPVEGIITAEAVVLDVQTAGAASRAVAGAIDVGVQVGLLFVATMLAGIIGFLDGADEVTAAAVIGMTVFLVMFIWPLVWEVRTRGRTIGKTSVGLRVVTLDGTPIRFRHAAVRSMAGIVDKWVPPGALVGMLFVLGTSSQQRIGDLLAGTIVIRDPSKAGLPVGVWFPVPVGMEGYAASLDPTAMTVDHYTVIRSFLMRNVQLTPTARYSLALDLSDRVCRVIHHTRPVEVHPEALLFCVIARYQRRHFVGYQTPTSPPR